MSTNVQALAVGGMNLFAGTDVNGVFRSTDNGTTWMPVNTGFPLLGVGSLVVCGSNLFAEADANGVYRFTPGDTTWIPVNVGLPRSEFTSFAASGANLFVGAYGPVSFFRPTTVQAGRRSMLALE